MTSRKTDIWFAHSLTKYTLGFDLSTSGCILRSSGNKLSVIKGIVSGFPVVRASSAESDSLSEPDILESSPKCCDNKGLLTEREVCTVKYQTEVF